jgi:hypothetical protein
MTHQQALDKQSVERYLLDEMPEIERYAFEEHLFDCEICAEDVRAGAVMVEGVKAGLRPPAAAGASIPAAPAIGTVEPRESREPLAPREPRELREPRGSPRSPWRVALPWAVAASLAVAAAYQTLWVVPALRDQIIGPTVLSPVTLRGASRGPEPTLTRPAGVISLAVDLSGVPAGSRLSYDLRAADGRSVASGAAAAPPPGTPLLLLIPASSLDAPGQYVLAVVTGDGPGSVEYRFTIESEK